MGADMPSAFWSGWIIVLTVVSLVGLTWLVFSIYFSKNKELEEATPVWDENLREGTRPAPMWWFWMIFTALIATVIYLILYPGLGSYNGLLNWSQGARHDHSNKYFASKFQSSRDEIMQFSITDIQKTPLLMQSAKQIFKQNCANCHGDYAQGQANHFPNLKDKDWQWGGNESDIETSIRKGRKAIMVGWLPTLGKEGTNYVVNYIQTFSSSDEQGSALYNTYCVACHGKNGEGNTLLGAPNLSDDIWLYGSSEKNLYETVGNGRAGVMPAFENRLDDMQIRLLVAWLLNQNG